MPAQIESFHGYALATSRESGVFYSDARRDAEDFDVNKDTIIAWTHWLENQGWMDRLDKGKRLKRNPVTGMYASIRYRVLDHDGWADKHPGKCRYVGDNHLADDSREKEDLSEKIGQDSARDNSHLSETTRTTCPKKPVPPVRKVRTKTVSRQKEDRECAKPENPSSSNPPTAVPKEKNQSPRLADITVTTAIETNPAASFSGKSKAEIVRVIEETNPTEEELVPIVRAIVNQLDDFQLRNAGSALAASLAGHIMAMRKKKTEADNQAVVHEKEMRVVQEEIAARERDMKETMAKAKAEEDRLRQHYPDDSFCACPQCQPDSWNQDAFEETANA